MLDRLAAKLFALTLAIYPPELREQFGDEMEFVFAEQISAAWRDGGARAAAQVWATAVKEVATVAVPNRLAPVAVPAIAILASLLWFVGVLGLIHVARN